MNNAENEVKITPLSVKSRMKIKFFNEAELESINEATLTVLEEAGIKFPSQKALKILADAGAKVDFNTHIVKFPSDLVLNSIEKAPRNIIMAARDREELDIHIDGTKTYFGTDGTGTKTIDFVTRQRRASTKADVEKMAIISDYLPNISFYCPLVSAQDVPGPVIPVHEIEAAYNFTEKHIQTETMGDANVARYAVKIAELIAGGKNEMRKRPPLDTFVCTVAPLGQDSGGIEAALIYAEAGLPVGFMAMPNMCSTGPGYLAGSIVVGNAEILSAITLIQIAYPGSPVYYSLIPGFSNPFTGGFLLGVPQKTILNTAGIQLGHYYDLPVMSGAFGATDSHEPDKWQTGHEVTRGPIMVTLAGADFSVGMGLLEAYTLLYPEKILFDNEIFNYVKSFVEGVKVTTETLAIDEILKAGPGGHFLNFESTKKNLRKLWTPGIIHQWDPVKNDFKEPQEEAISQINWILKNHKPKPLDEKMKNEIRKIVESAEKDLIQ